MKNWVFKEFAEVQANLKVLRRQAYICIPSTDRHAAHTRRLINETRVLIIRANRWQSAETYQRRSSSADLCSILAFTGRERIHGRRWLREMCAPALHEGRNVKDLQSRKPSHLVLVLIENDEPTALVARLIEAGIHIKTALSTDEALAQLLLKNGPFSAVLIIDNGLFSDAVRRIEAVDSDLPIVESAKAQPIDGPIERLLAVLQSVDADR